MKPSYGAGKAGAAKSAPRGQDRHDEGRGNRTACPDGMGMGMGGTCRPVMKGRK